MGNNMAAGGSKSSKTGDDMSTTDTGEPSLIGATFDLARYYLGGRRGLILLSVAAVGAALAFNWSWLVAVGAAPLLLALAPCAAMCALGLCMNRSGGKSCSSESSASDAGAPTESPKSE